MNQTYIDVKNLRYGSILIMANKDENSSYIKGSIINFIHSLWPSLIKLKGFIREFITPIIKANKNNEIISFYSLKEYNKWISIQGKEIKNWNIKYYKGLGSFNINEIQDYFSDIQRHILDYEYKNEKDDEIIDIFFNKNKSEERKNLYINYEPNENIPSQDFDFDGVNKISFNDFFNKELILYPMSDNQRSIPSICDGLKPSERKVLYGCFKKNLKNEIKVSKLIGYIIEQTLYKYGETSAGATIIAMSQNFTGSNNINLLKPNGQFGTRYYGGRDASNTNSIYTKLNNITKYIYNENDFPLMDYIIEEGQKIEPKWYLPIIPMILVN